MIGLAQDPWFHVLLGALALAGWTFVGYPMAVRLRARLFPRPVAGRAWSPSVSVIVCVHDALPELQRKLPALLEAGRDRAQFEVIVVSDGSGDGTAAWLSRFDDPRVRSVVHEQRRGKSACLADAVLAARHDVLVFTDARQRLEPGSIDALCAALVDDGYRLVGGRLAFESEDGYGASIGAYWRYEQRLREAEALTGSCIGVSGALYAVRRPDMPLPPPGLILDDVWVPMEVARRGGRIGLEPRAIAWDRPSSDPAAEARRKRRTLAGNWQLLRLHPGWLLPWRHRLWFRWLSHKLLRLVMAPVLVAALVANLVLAGAHPALDALLVAQLGAWALGIAGMLAPRLRRLAPVRICAAFLELNAFAVLGLLDVVRGRAQPTWPAATQRTPLAPHTPSGPQGR